MQTKTLNATKAAKDEFILRKLGLAVTEIDEMGAAQKAGLRRFLPRPVGFGWARLVGFEKRSLSASRRYPS